jgi:Tfp pilus assembly protein PilX
MGNLRHYQRLGSMLVVQMLVLLLLALLLLALLALRALLALQELLAAKTAPQELLEMCNQQAMS